MKLYFRYGAVGSAKTLNLLAVAHCYRQQGKKILLLKPEMDVRFGRKKVKSRAGLIQDADILLSDTTILNMQEFQGIDCVLVDECQFLTPDMIDQFRAIVDIMRVPVICYGLRTDFRTKLFAGSQRLFELADSLEEIKTTCFYCNRKALINLKLADGAPTTGGPQVCLGTEETYIPCCSKDYHARIPREVTTLLGFDKLGLGEKPVDPARDLQALSGLLSTPKQKELAEQEGGADPAVLTTTPSPVNDRIKSLAVDEGEGSRLRFDD